MRIELKLQTLFLFIAFFLTGLGFQALYYFDQKKTLERNIEDVFEAERLRLSEVFDEQIELLNFVKKRLELQDQFNKNRFKSLIQDVENSFRDIYSFNYTDGDNIIRYVYPEERNKAALNQDLKKHPDSVVFDIFKKGISRTEITFLPPVMTYQGERAVIFYCPVSFKGGEKGLLNLVIAADDLFSAYRQETILNVSGFSVFDKKTKRYYFNSIKETEDKYLKSFTGSFLGRDVVYSFDIGDSLKAQKFRLIQQLIFILIVVGLLSYYFHHSSRNREEVAKKYFDIKSDSNLLKTLIHDISTPILTLQMGLKKLSKQNSEDQELISKLIRRVDVTTDIIATIRDVLRDQREQYPVIEMDLKSMIQDILQRNEETIKQGGLIIKTELDDDCKIKVRTEKNILKNQILANLIQNALKFSPANGEVSIKFEKSVLTITNYADFLSEERLRVLNSEGEIESSKDRDQNVSLGYGLFIAKLFCRHANIKMKITQDPETLLVQNRLQF